MISLYDIIAKYTIWPLLSPLLVVLIPFVRPLFFSSQKQNSQINNQENNNQTNGSNKIYDVLKLGIILAIIYFVYNAFFGKNSTYKRAEESVKTTSELSGEVQDLVDKHYELAQGHKGVKDEWLRRYNECEERLKTIRNDKRLTRQEQEKIDKTVEQTKIEIEHIRTQIQKAKKHEQELTALKNAKQQEYEKNRQRIDELKSIKGLNKEQQEENQREIERLDRRNFQLIQEIEALSQQITGVQGSIVSLEKQLALLEKECDNLAIRSDQFKKKVADLNAVELDVKQERDKIKKKLREITRKEQINIVNLKVLEYYDSILTQATAAGSQLMMENQNWVSSFFYGTGKFISKGVHGIDRLITNKLGDIGKFLGIEQGFGALFRAFTPEEIITQNGKIDEQKGKIITQKRKIDEQKGKIKSQEINKADEKIIKKMEEELKTLEKLHENYENEKFEMEIKLANLENVSETTDSIRKKILNEEMKIKECQTAIAQKQKIDQNEKQIIASEKLIEIYKDHEFDLETKEEIKNILEQDGERYKKLLFDSNGELMPLSEAAAARERQNLDSRRDRIQRDKQELEEMKKELEDPETLVLSKQTALQQRKNAIIGVKGNSEDDGGGGGLMGEQQTSNQESAETVAYGNKLMEDKLAISSRIDKIRDQQLKDDKARMNIASKVVEFDNNQEQISELQDMNKSINIASNKNEFFDKNLHRHQTRINRMKQLA